MAAAAEAAALASRARPPDALKYTLAVEPVSRIAVRRRRGCDSRAMPGNWGRGNRQNNVEVKQHHAVTDGQCARTGHGEACIWRLLVASKDMTHLRCVI